MSLYGPEPFVLKNGKAVNYELTSDQSLRFILFDRKDETKMWGTANFTQFFRGPFQACFLGYGISKQHEGRGLMKEGLEAAIHYVFREKNLHRIMANHLPENTRSASLLKSLGFRIEGTARDYLYVNGAWRDHVLNSLTNPCWRNIFDQI